jgi:energy-converting hydrogenase Eha subunit H
MNNKLIIAITLIVVSVFILVAKPNKTVETTRISTFCATTQDIYSQQECRIYKKKVIECWIEVTGTMPYEMCMADLMMTKYNISNCMR